MDPLSSGEEFPLTATAAGLAGGYLPSVGAQPPGERGEVTVLPKELLKGHFWLPVLV